MFKHSYGRRPTPAPVQQRCVPTHTGRASHASQLSAPAPDTGAAPEAVQISPDPAADAVGVPEQPENSPATASKPARKG